MSAPPEQKHKVSINLGFEAGVIAFAIILGLCLVANAIERHTDMEAARDGVHRTFDDKGWTKP